MKQISIILQFVARRNSKKGSYTLEAAILLPIFIVGILTLGFTIRMISTAENITFAATDEARIASTVAYNLPMYPFFAENLKDRILEENEFATSVTVEDFHYLDQTFEMDGIISFRTDYWIETGLPLGMVDGLEMSQVFHCRGFIGRSIAGNPFPFEEMENDATANTVWIFPEEGTRYHAKSCSFISAYPMQMVLNQDIKKHYEPCQRCSSAEAEFGTQVYCFQSYGEAYHLGDCPTVKKYVISMERKQAEDRGYTPCLKCGGIE